MRAYLDFTHGADAPKFNTGVRGLGQESGGVIDYAYTVPESTDAGGQVTANTGNSLDIPKLVEQLGTKALPYVQSFLQSRTQVKTAEIAANAPVKQPLAQTSYYRAGQVPGSPGYYTLAQSGDNTLLWVGGGLAVAALIYVLIGRR